MDTAIRVKVTGIIFCFLLLACREKFQNGITAIDVPAYESNEFLEFYNRFSNDSAFQMEHIVFPLEGMPALKDSSDVIPIDFKWDKDTWILHKPYDDMNGTFAREFIDFKGIVIEKIADSSGRYSMERRFSKMNDGWHLIYYRAMGMSDFN